VVNENFNPDFFLLLKDSHDVLVVEIKHDEAGDDNRNKAKFRDAKAHFKRLNEVLEEAEQPWRYYFYFLSPEDYTMFFDRIRDGKYKGWR
jgi:type III restriction enzyme